MMRITNILPPIVTDLILKLIKPIHGFSGDYKSYADALRKCRGYQDESIVKMYEQKLLIALDSEFSTDLKIDDRSIRLLNGFLFSLTELGINNNLNVLDFGGSWGNHYFNIFAKLEKKLINEYVICESKAVSNSLSKLSSPIKFVSHVENFSDKHFDVSIASCVLPYLEFPYEALSEISRVSKFIILDRMPIIKTLNKDVLMIQKNFGRLNSISSYPAFFFSESVLFKELQKLNLEIKFSWGVNEDKPHVFGERFPYSGYLLKVLN